MEFESPTFFHASVLVNESINFLNISKNGIYVDATFGSGGHSRAILDADPTVTVVAIDWDRISLEKYAPLLEQEYGKRFIPIFGNFAHLYKLLKNNGFARVNGILADFGTSQMQIQERPGFSIYRDMPLDMRMSLSHQKTTAAEVLNTASEKSLADIFYLYGQERFARKIARAIIQDRDKRPFKTTKDLADLVARIIPRQRQPRRIHPATKIFQALRIHVNNELANIGAFLKGAVGALAPSGRLVCISFHSLEDRLVKQFFKQCEESGTMEIVTKKAIIPSPEEIRLNPSARSAKLRAAARISQ